MEESLHPYTSVAKRAQGEYIEKKSRFIATVTPAQDESQALAFLAQIRSTYPDARHNVYAYRLLDNHTTRYSDDGEPQGTAGVPVLDVLQKNGLENVAIVVTRYFGGILLGASGLVRAYTAAAVAALEQAGLVRYQPCAVFGVDCSYSLYQKWIRDFDRMGVRILHSDFDASVHLELSVLCDKADMLCAFLTESSAGSVTPTLLAQRLERI